MVFDEAHKYLSPTGSDPLSSTIVHLIRQMRHHGIRIAISSQSPRTLPPELLELASMVLMHRFHSKDWFDYLKSKLTLTPEAFEEIIGLERGEALCFSTRWARDLGLQGTVYERLGHGVCRVCVRQRMTAPSGSSKVSG